jgi:drug/metabolite transporter (DMT)-like permease
VDLTSAVHASILSAAIPMFTLILAAFFLKEKILIHQWCGLLMGTAGILLISVKTEIGSSSSILGDIFVLVSCLMWAFYVIHIKKAGKIIQLPNEVFTALTIAAGTIISAPLAFIEMTYLGMPVWTFSSFLNLMYVALLSTVIAYLIWNRVMETVTAASAGVWITFLPLVEVLTSVVLLNEELTWRVLVGGLFVLLGVFWAEHFFIRIPLKRNQQNRNFSP